LHFGADFDARNNRKNRNSLGTDATQESAQSTVAPVRHLWIRMGGPIFCGKEGCGLIRTEESQRLECRGIESPGIAFLRSFSGGAGR
jgi:hypothetical protein